MLTSSSVKRYYLEIFAVVREKTTQYSERDRVCQAIEFEFSGNLV